MASGTLSRREFLKLVGAGIAVGVLGKFIDFSIFTGQKSGSFREASAQQAGTWALGPRATITPIHLVILSTGKVLYLAGSGYHQSNKDGPFKAELMDPETGAKVQYSFPVDFFCIGHNHLANGNVLLTGGTKRYDVDNPEGLFEGGNYAYLFDVYTSTFTRLPDIRHGRWYPTQTVLPDGRVVVVGGLDEYGHLNALVEVFDPATQTFSVMYDPTPNRTIDGSAAQANGQGQWCAGTGSPMPGAGTVCYGNATNQGNAPPLTLYPRMHLMPSGLIATVGSDMPVYLLNPATGHWGRVGQTIYPFRDYGTSFLLPLQNNAAERGRIIIVGGAQDGVTPATTSCEMIDFNAGTNTAPVIRAAGSLNIARHYPIPITLPDGKLVVFAGTTGAINTNYVLTPEVYDPASDTWTRLADARAGRSYHGDGVLLPDGRVFISSSTPDRVNWETRSEIFSPGYMFATRPTISGNVSTAPYGGTIRIPTPDAADITSVSLVRLASSTHHFDPNMRLVWLPVTTKESAAVLVAAPINANIAPPGPYYIHVLNSSGIPSAAKVINIPGTIC